MNTSSTHYVVEVRPLRLLRDVGDAILGETMYIGSQHFETAAQFPCHCKAAEALREYGMGISARILRVDVDGDGFPHYTVSNG